MPLLRPTLAATLLGFSTLPQRWKGALAVVAALMVVTVAMNPLLILADSFIRASSAQHHPLRAVISEPGKRWIFDSHLQDDWIEIIKRAPGIAPLPDGRPFADAQAALHCGALIRIAKDCVHLIGMEPAGFAMRPEIKLVKGHLPRPGHREFAVGAMVTSPALATGKAVRLLGNDWLVTGTFVTGTVFDREAVADSATLRAATRAPSFNHVVVRLASPEAFHQLQDALQGRPGMNVLVEREEEHFRRSSGQLSIVPQALSYVVGILLGLGAFAGIFHTMHGAVEARQREIGIMRAVGFPGSAVAAAVALEAMLLACGGALLGMLMLWLWLDGSMFRGIFQLSITPARLGFATIWALAIALLGAISPALGVARLQVADALRR
jgi:putative ABC transport system permease protein